MRHAKAVEEATAEKNCGGFWDLRSRAHSSGPSDETTAPDAAGTANEIGRSSGSRAGTNAADRQAPKGDQRIEQKVRPMAMKTLDDLFLHFVKDMYI